MPEETREQRPLAAEVKFLLTPDIGAAVRNWARSRLPADPYGTGEGGDGYHTTSLYFETADQDVFNRRGSYGRSKYRIRRYAMSDLVFLERKLRTSDLLSKRRSLVPIDELPLLEAAPEAWPYGWPGAWFGHRVITRRLAPVCQVAYDRIARVTPTPYGVARLTLDTHVGAWPTAHCHFQDSKPQPVLPDRVIMEMKFRVEIPAVFKALVEEFRLSPTALSKYRLSMVALGLAAPLTRHEIAACPTC